MKAASLQTGSRQHTGSSQCLHSRSVLRVRPCALVSTRSSLCLKQPLEHSRLSGSVCRAAETAAEASAADDQVAPGCSRYSVSLSKPLGLVLEEDRNKNIFVAEVLPNGNAEACGLITAGDQLIATSGKIFTTESIYGETLVRGGEKFVRLNCRGEDFKTVMAAISSHPVTRQVELEFQRCDPNEQA